MITIKKIYDNLYSHFGPQGWWPLTPKGKLLSEHNAGRPKNDQDCFEIIIGSILTQNTNWKNVEKALYQLNRNKLIDPKKIIKTPIKKIAKIIKSSGYHTQKAERLKIFSHYLLKNYNGNFKNWFSKDIGSLRIELLTIKGIGPETADSIILYAAEKPSFVIDAYTKRILNRIGYKQQTYDDFQHLFEKNLNKNLRMFKEYHALLVALGKNICKTRPLCNVCPLNYDCKRIKVTASK